MIGFPQGRLRRQRAPIIALFQERQINTVSAHGSTKLSHRVSIQVPRTRHVVETSPIHAFFEAWPTKDWPNPSLRYPLGCRSRLLFDFSYRQKPTKVYYRSPEATQVYWLFHQGLVVLSFNAFHASDVVPRCFLSSMNPMFSGSTTNCVPLLSNPQSTSDVDKTVDRLCSLCFTTPTNSPVCWWGVQRASTTEQWGERATLKGTSLPTIDYWWDLPFSMTYLWLIPSLYQYYCQNPYHIDI